LQAKSSPIKPNPINGVVNQSLIGEVEDA
jgi:hypothetical protein